MSKTVLLSGGTNGIGKGAVLQLLKEGYNVSTFSRDEKKVAKLKEELQEFDSSKFLVLCADVNNEKNVKEVVKKTIETFGNIDILINNAGFGYFANADEVDMNRFQEMIQTNVVGVALLTKFVLPYMKKKKEGQIINISSTAGKRAYAMGEFYNATKFAVMGYSDGLRQELKPFGIKVSTVCPGMTKTDFFSKKDLEERKKLWGYLPKPMDVTDISRVISLICSQSKESDIQDITVAHF